jgi:hypothetical protein
VTSGPPGSDSSRDVAREAPLTVFVSDPSAEAERMTQALRAAGYAVVDVPLSMLIARVAVQVPRVILVDADAEGALDAVSRLRDLPDAEAIDVVFVGKEGAALQSPEDALAHEGSGFFSRPVDVPGLVRKIQVLTGGPMGKEAPTRPSAPPPALSYPGGADGSRPMTLPPASMRAGSEPPRLDKRVSDRPPPRSQPPAADTGAHGAGLDPARRSPSVQAPLSSELETLLAEAELRIGAQMLQESIPPTPEEEIEAVLPAEILSSLDEPIDEEDEDDLDLPRGAGEEDPRPAARQITSTGRAPETSEPGDSAQAAKTHGGRSDDERSATTGTRAGQSVIDTGSRVDLPRDATPSSRGNTSSASPLGPQQDSVSSVVRSVSTSDESLATPSVQGPPTEYGSPAAYTALPPPPGSPAASTLGSSVLEPHAVGLQEIISPSLPMVSTQPPQQVMSTQPPSMHGRSKKAQSVPPPAPIPSVIAKGEAPLVLARAIALRSTGALCIESEDGVRRVVLREGDLVTAASGVENETLLAFLGGRGELPRETIQQLAGKVPPFGRHAGAALVAHGHLRQDQLWPVLRAHAEWILGRLALLSRGTALLEQEPPGRLKGEPSVFGGSTGAEVLVEVVRRVIAPEEATARMGGLGSRMAEGPSFSLLSECALDAGEREVVTRMPGATLGDMVAASTEPDFASVLYGLSLLGVVDVVHAISAGVGPGDNAGSGPDLEPPVDALDEDAIRERVRARLALVDDADYFALLGVSPDATGYEVRRAFLELRRAFDPQRVLTPQIADLSDDVRKIVGVLEEAYEILKDEARRERYRRAIEAVPGS